MFYTTKTKLKKGFSLIEIVVVLAIMAIIAAVVAPQFGKYTNKADANKIQSELSIIHTAAINLAEEKESNLHEYFEGSKKDELKKELQSITNYDMKKIEEFKFGVANRKFVVYLDSDTDYYWDGQNLTNTAPSGLVPINTDARAKLVAEFTKTGGTIPDVVSKYFIFNGGGEYGDTIEGLTNLGREHFRDVVIIPEKDDAGTVIKYIKANAFRGEGLTKVYIPSNITTIGAGAFTNNGPSKNSNSIEEPSVNKYYNGYTGEWRVLNGKWEKTVVVVDVDNATENPRRLISELDYKALGLDKLHKLTVVTRVPNSTDPFSILSPAATPGREVPATYVDNAAEKTVSVDINAGNVTSYGERTLYKGSQFEVRTVTGHRPSPGTSLTWNYSGHLDGFLFTGVLNQDKVINGGTPAGSKYIEDYRPSPGTALSVYYSEPGLNGYSGTLTNKTPHIAGSPAQSETVSGIDISPNTAATAVYSKSIGTAPFNGTLTGTLNRYVYSGTPADSKQITGYGSGTALTLKYNEGGYSGTLNANVSTPISGSPAHTKYVDDQPSASYNSGGYSGTLTAYQKETVAAHSKSITYGFTAYSKEWFEYTKKTSYSYITRVRQTWDLWAEYFYASPTGGWANWIDRADRRNYSSKIGQYLSGGKTYYYHYDDYTSSTNTTWFTRTNLSNGNRYHIQNVSLYAVYRATTESYSWEQSYVEYYAKDSFTATYAYNSGGYSGTLSKSGSPHTNKTVEDHATGSAAVGTKRYRLYSWTQDYKGTVTKPAEYTTRYRGNVSRPDTRVYNYSGTVSKPDTRVWRYQGTISKPDTRVWSYHGTVTKPDTRVWDYSGQVVGDTRLYKNYYYYKLILE